MAMGDRIELTAADGHALTAYEADPGQASRGVVVVQEIFGVNGHIRDVTDRYAELGFRAVAPALFDRVTPRVELDYDADGVAEGRALRARIPWDHAVADMGAAVAHLADSGPVGVVGYCYGGSLAFLAATRLSIAAAVGYYGGQIVEFLDETPRCPLMLHFGEADSAIPLEDVAKIEATFPDVPVHVYEGAGHGFNCDRRGSFDEPSAGLALDRTLEFLDRAMR
jgi:carboxymethylenebutenolidase